MMTICALGLDEEEITCRLTRVRSDRAESPEQVGRRAASGGATPDPVHHEGNDRNQIYKNKLSELTCMGQAFHHILRHDMVLQDGLHSRAGRLNDNLCTTSRMVHLIVVDVDVLALRHGKHSLVVQELGN